MNIVIDASVYESRGQRGIARIFTNTLPLICDAHPEVNVTLIFRKPPQMAYPQHPQIKIIFLPNVYRLRPWRFWKTRYKMVQDGLILLLVGLNPRNIWFSTYFTTPPSKWRGKQVVFVHDMIYELFRELMPESKKVIELKRNAILHADKVFCNSETTASDLVRLYPTVQSKVIVTHLSHDKFFTHLSKDMIKTVITEEFILYVGKRDYYKDFATLLEAYAQWKHKTKIRLFLVGPELTSEEKSSIVGLGLINNIKIFANADDQTLRDLYNQALAFVYPSLYEGFGIPLLEAMACGCVVIASRIPSTLEIVKDAPVYFEPDNPASLNEALDVIFDEEEINTHIAKGYQISSEYSWEKTAQKMYEGIKELNA